MSGPNHSREDLEKQGNTEMGLFGGLLAGLAVAVGGAILNSMDKSSIRARIDEIDQEIDDLRSEFMGSFLNGDQIERLKSERRTLVQKLGGSE